MLCCMALKLIIIYTALAEIVASEDYMIMNIK